jgi:hypothetical protein
VKITEMPPQKNSGNRGAKRETGATIKNRRFVQDFLDDLRKEGIVEDVFIGRVIRRMGDGRMEVFYTERVKDENKGRVTQAKIPGRFSGKGKHSVWIQEGTFVAIASTGVNGSAAFEIVAVFNPDQMRDISREFDLDSRITAVEHTDAASLLANKGRVSKETGFEFDNIADDDIDVDNI